MNATDPNTPTTNNPAPNDREFVAPAPPAPPTGAPIATQDSYDAPAKPGLPGWIRLVIVLATGVAGFFAAGFLLFVGYIVFTGCFFDCSDNPQPLLGLTMMLGAPAVVGGWAALVAWAVGRPQAARKTFLIVAPLAAVIVVVLASFA